MNVKDMIIEVIIVYTIKHFISFPRYLIEKRFKPLKQVKLYEKLYCM